MYCERLPLCLFTNQREENKRRIWDAYFFHLLARKRPHRSVWWWSNKIVIRMYADTGLFQALLLLSQMHSSTALVLNLYTCYCSQPFITCYHHGCHYHCKEETLNPEYSLLFQEINAHCIASCPSNDKHVWMYRCLSGPILNQSDTFYAMYICVCIITLFMLMYVCEVIILCGSLPFGLCRTHIGR